MKMNLLGFITFKMAEQRRESVDEQLFGLLPVFGPLLLQDRQIVNFLSTKSLMNKPPGKRPKHTFNTTNFQVD